MTRTPPRFSIRRVFAALVLVAGLSSLASFGGPAPAAADSCPTSNRPNELTLAGGTPQTSKLNTPFADMFQVTLANTNGCPITTQVAGSAVTFTAPSSGASGTFSASGSSAITVGTNAAGAAGAPPFTANGNTGSYTITASSDYGSVSFWLTNTAAGIASSITAGASTSQSATAGSRYAQPLQATVLDANGNPVEGVSVTFALGSSTGGAGGGAGSTASVAGASFNGGQAQATEVTNVSGIATSPLFTANSTAGVFTATAATAGVVEPASFSLDNLAGPPPTITALTPAKRSATVSAHYRKRLHVKVLNGSGEPIQGASVIFTIGAGGGAGGGNSTSSTAGASFDGGSAEATETTNAAGAATSPRFVANTVAGTFTATATTTDTRKAATFALRNLPARPATINAGVAATESTAVGMRFPIRLAVTVEDAHANPVPRVVVTFTAPARGPGGHFGSKKTRTVNVRTDPSGVAVAPAFVANHTPGGYVVRATVHGVARAAAFALINQTAS
jgi:adhesin/invasin